MAEGDLMKLGRIKFRVKELRGSGSVARDKKPTSDNLERHNIKTVIDVVWLKNLPWTSYRKRNLWTSLLLKKNHKEEIPRSQMLVPELVWACKLVEFVLENKLMLRILSSVLANAQELWSIFMFSVCKNGWKASFTSNKLVFQLPFTGKLLNVNYVKQLIQVILTLDWHKITLQKRQLWNWRQKIWCCWNW